MAKTAKSEYALYRPPEEKMLQYFSGVLASKCLKYVNQSILVA